MAEATDTETHKKMADEMNQADLTSETETGQQQMVELQPLLSSQPSDPSHNHFQQQQHLYASPFTSVTVGDEVTIDIRKVIQNCGDALLLQDLCIFKVPITLRYLNEEAYTPQFVSIGPFHYGNERLQEMERHKPVLFKIFTQRAKSSLDDLVCLVKDLESRVRASYSETINLTRQQLVKLTLMDAGFVIELFLMNYMRHGVQRDAKLSQPWLYESLFEDLLLLENQLPFFVIEELFNKAFHFQVLRGIFPSFLKLMYEYFGQLNKQQLEPNPDVKIKHFTDLLRLFYLQGNMSERHVSQEDKRHLLYNANALHEAGIQFKVCESKCLLDLKFSGHILEIPQIAVDDNTELLFRNMIALEQCHYPYDMYISDYATVLDCLIDTYKDVDLLIHKKIVLHSLGDNLTVASLFNGLGKNVLEFNFNSDYFEMNQSLNDYCEDLWNKMKATLRHDYCNTPWHTLASIAGIILLVLTIVQTICSVLQVVLKK
ncbi:hypothetical protein QN277_001925 [Acacia crassicarpa]|uniref:Uncharacterized protein n=1 Tax=Acacia crassicarpa TaxID=499986 RepID=A0AAE1N864_9FABA|nr:hypothetical protein QN277_001925 [Acacia crassicarpa]